jgi:hypothetical protein
MSAAGQRRNRRGAIRIEAARRTGPHGTPDMPVAPAVMIRRDDPGRRITGGAGVEEAGVEEAMAEQYKIVCPRCDSVVAIAPKEGLKSTDLRCNNCGAALRAPGPIEQATETVKAVLQETKEQIEKTLRSR